MVIIYDALCVKLFNRQTRWRALTVGGKHYDQTLMAWYDNFMNAWSELKPSYEERFKGCGAII